jgi:hypothetical protein
VLPQLDMVVVFTGGGFEPADVGAFLVKALRSDRPLPEDPAGYATLQEKIAAAARSPAPQRVLPLPVIAAAISGREYLLETNVLGLRSIGFTFDGGDTARLDLGYADRRESRPIGLDGVYRITRENPDAQPDAVKGGWLSESEFSLTYNEFTESKCTTARAAFRGNGVILRVSDHYDDLDSIIRGRVSK